MTSNPYESSEICALGPNVYRDGWHLVINCHDDDVEEICMGSGLPANNILPLQNRVESPENFLVRSVLGNGLLTRSLTSDPENAEIKVMVNDSWVKESRRQRIKNYCVVGVGCLAVVAGIVLIVVHELLMFLGFAIFLCSVVYAFAKRNSTRQLVITKKKRDWVWILGVHPKVLAAHPDIRSNKKLEFLTYR